MATTGTTTFSMTGADMLDEAFERVGIDPASINARHINSALRSLHLLLVEVEGRPGSKFLRDHVTLSIPEGASAVPLPAGTLEVLKVVTKASGESDMPLTRISGDTWTQYPDKTTTGRPSVFWIDHQSPVATDIHSSLTSSDEPPVLVVWPVANTTYTATIWRSRLTQDSTLSATVDLRRAYFEAIAAGLAARLAVKYAPQKLQALKTEFAEQLEIAQGADGQGGVFIIGNSYRGTRRRRL